MQNSTVYEFEEHLPVIAYKQGKCNCICEKGLLGKCASNKKEVKTYGHIAYIGNIPHLSTYDLAQGKFVQHPISNFIRIERRMPTNDKRNFVGMPVNGGVVVCQFLSKDEIFSMDVAILLHPDGTYTSKSLKKILNEEVW